MKFIATRKFNLIPIGKVKFSFNKRKGCVYIGELNIMCNTDMSITAEEEKALHKEMKDYKSELLTDGRDFYTTRGTKITQIMHKSFNELLGLEENKKMIHELRFG